MEEKKNIPEIRFKGFEGEWEVKRFKSVAEFNPKDEIPETFKYVDLESVVGIEMVSYRTEKKNTAPSRAQRFARNGDLFYQAVRPYQKNNYLFSKPDTDYVFSTGYTQIRSKINGYFLLSLVQNNSFVKIVLNNCTGTSYPSINSNELANIDITLAPLSEEQSQIGSFFQNLDKQITLEQQKHNKLVTLKKAMLEKMFPKEGKDIPEIRFKGFEENWEEKQLKNISDITGGGTPSTTVPEYWNGEIDWYSPTEIGNKVYVDGSVKKITSCGLNNSSAKILPKNKTILFTSRAGIGDMAILKKNGATNQGFQSFVVKNGIEPYFIYSAGHLIKTYALKHASGSTFLEVSGKTLGEMDLLIPSEYEQTKIGSFFQNLDKLISLQQKKIDKLKNIKKACLEKMFV